MRILFKTSASRYLVVGISVYVLELIIIAVSQTLGAGDLLAVTLSFWLGLIVSFILQKVFTFGDKRLQRKVLLPQLLAVCLLVIFNFVFTIAINRLLRDAWPVTLTRTLALGITTIWNFHLYKTRIFNTSLGLPID